MDRRIVRVQKIKKRLLREHRKIGSWRELARQYPPIKFGTLQRFATDPSYTPVDDEILIALGVKAIRKYKPPVPLSSRWWRELRKRAVRAMATKTRQGVLRK